MLNENDNYLSKTNIMLTKLKFKIMTAKCKISKIQLYKILRNLLYNNSKIKITHKLEMENAPMTYSPSLKNVCPQT